MGNHCAGTKLAAVSMLLTLCGNLLAAQVDITSFGAVPNDGLDDVAAINSAIHSASAGDTVFIPAGTFSITSSVSPKSGVKLAGAGVDASVLRFTGLTLKPMVNASGRSNMEFSGFTLDGNNNAKAQHGFNIYSSSGVSIHHVKVTNLVPTGGYGPAAVYFSSDVTDSTIADSSFVNIGVGASYGSGIRIENGSNRNRVLRNTVDTTGRGGIFGSASTDLVIQGNTVTGSGGTGLGIEVWGGSDRALIEDNVIDHWLSVDSSSGSAIRRNTVSDKSGTVKLAGLELVASHDVVFDGNVVDGGAQIGISLSNNTVKERLLFRRNTISGCKTWGAQLQGDAGGISRLYLRENTFESTVASASGNAFGITAPQGHGVRFNGNVAGPNITNVVMDGNVIRDNGGKGIQLSSNLDLLSFVNNTITGNAGDSIESNSIANLAWSGNTVSGNGTNRSRVPSGDFGGNTAPSCTILAGAMTAAAGEPLSFGLGYMDAEDGSAPAAVLWDLGDGLPQTGLAPTHVYATAGVYSVAVVAWDAGGRAVYAETSVTIVPEPQAALVTLLAAALGFRRRRVA